MERCARELRAPLLAGQSEALRQSLLELVRDRAALEEAASMAVHKAERLEMAIEENKRRYEDTLRSFDRFRQAFDIVSSLRSLEDLPELLERVRSMFRVGMVRLVMDEAQFGPYLPSGFPVWPQERLQALAVEVGSAGSGSFLGFAGDAPEGVFGRNEARRFGSCFVYPLEDRFRDGYLAGFIVVADASPGRYRPEMAADYMEHFSDALASSVVDVTDRRKAEELREDVERITRHDLRSPLSAILTLPQFLLEADNLTSRQREMISLMHESGRRMQSMITLSLSLYRMERGSYQLEPELVDLVLLARTIWEESGGPYRSAKMTLTVETDEEPFLVMGEELLCYTMLANLINNALEASSPGEGVIARFRREPGWAVAEVANGRDVPEDIRDRFFEKYATCGKRGGTGLGTYTARLVARVHGGDVELETGGGQGTVVRVRLPDMEPRS